MNGQSSLRIYEMVELGIASGSDHLIIYCLGPVRVARSP
jgi:hypothetical protein